MKIILNTWASITFYLLNKKLFRRLQDNTESSITPAPAYNIYLPKNGEKEKLAFFNSQKDIANAHVTFITVDYNPSSNSLDDMMLTCFLEMRRKIFYSFAQWCYMSDRWSLIIKHRSDQTKWLGLENSHTLHETLLVRDLSSEKAFLGKYATLCMELISISQDTSCNILEIVILLFDVLFSCFV